MKHLFEKLHQHFPQPTIDKVEHIDANSHIVTIKNITRLDPSGHGQWLGGSVPQQTMIDAHIQSCVLYLLNENYLEDHRYQLAKIQSFDAINDAFPGDQLRIESEFKSSKNDLISFESRSYVNGSQSSEMTLQIRQTNASTSSTFIHPTASVHSSAVLGHGVHIGPYCIVNEGVHIGDHTHLTAHVMIDKWSIIGKHNAIEFGAVIGSQAQDVKYKGEVAYVKIGDHNQIREYVTINRATGKDEVTEIGSNNMLLTNTHIGHNCKIGNKIVMANVVHVGGHVHIEDNATIGGLTGIHQFVRVGKGTMIGGYSRLIQDVPPFMLCDGNPAYVRNLNAIGCKRSGMSKSTLTDLKQLYKLLYRSNLNTKQALSEFSPEESSDEVDHLLAFIQHDASRGISKKSVADSTEE
jgi:UDP-N-acetylglucosamine acyltransferase